MTQTRTRSETSVWFITGASKGFGYALAEAVLAKGQCVAAASRSPQELQPLADSYPDRMLAVELDVTDASAARDVVQQTVSRFGRIDVVFNNAGFGYVGAIEELTDEQLREQLGVDLFGVINVTRAALPQLRRQRAGHFVQMSSLNGVEVMPGAGYYCASKFAIEGFSETLAAEVAPLGIKVTIVEPAPFRTQFLSEESLKWSEPIADYAETAGKARETLRSMDGKQPGDPRRAALAIIQAVEADTPPLRLPLGKMALDHIRKTLETRLKQLDPWAKVSAAADFPAGDANGSRHAHENLVRRAYDAFNNREIEDGVALMDPEVDWPKLPEGGFAHGQDQVRKHWREQFSQVDPHIDISDIREETDNRVEARVRQVVRRHDGTKVSDDRLVHLFTIANDRIKRLDIKTMPGRIR
jgi:NAD(P)-dependent dehydrogenase (short-subunit alcohol dehydrogenase family)